MCGRASRWRNRDAIVQALSVKHGVTMAAVATDVDALTAELLGTAS